MPKIHFDDGFTESMPPIPLSPFDLCLMSQQSDDQEGAMFDHDQSNENNSPQHEAVDVLVSLSHTNKKQTETSHPQPQFDDLCMARQVIRNSGIHFDKFMLDKFKDYGIGMSARTFFRNNAVFDESSFCSLCHHLSANPVSTIQLFDVFQNEAAKKMILGSIVFNPPQKNTVTSNPKITGILTHTIKLLLSCMSISVLLPVVCSPSHVLCSPELFATSIGFPLEWIQCCYGIIQQVQQSHRPSGLF